MKITIKTALKRLIIILPVLFIVIALLVIQDESRKPIIVYGNRFDILVGADEGQTAIANPDNASPGEFLHSPSVMLNPGTYSIRLTYSCSDLGSNVVIINNGRPVSSYDIVPGQTVAEYPFTLIHSSEDLYYSIVYGGGTLIVESGEIVPAGRFYNDTAYLCAQAVLIAIILALIPSGNLVSPLIIMGIGLVASLPYIDGGLPWAIDLCYHLSRLEGLKDSLIAGGLHGAIYPEALKGNGYLGLMYPQLLLYPSAILRALGVSMADSYKTLAIAINIATPAIMYLCTKSLGSRRGFALLAAALYTLAPYRIANIYARGAVGEYLAMTFFPLVIAGLWNVIKGRSRSWPVLTFGMCGLLYTHLLSVAIAAVVCFVICLSYARVLLRDRSRLLSLAKAAGLSALLGLGFLVPFLYYYKNGNLWMSALTSVSFFRYSLSNLSSFFAFPVSGDYHAMTLGFPLGIMLFIGILYQVEKLEKDDVDGFILRLVVLGLVSIYMISSFFPAGPLMDRFPALGAAFDSLQFAWRLIGPLSLFSAMAGALSLERMKALKAYAPSLIAVLFVMTLLVPMRFEDENFSRREDRDYSNGHYSKVTGIPKAANTILYPFEWRPENTGNDGLATDCLIGSETIDLVLYYRGGTTSTIVYSDIDEAGFIDIPVIYYPGYTAEDESGAVVPIGPGTNNMIRVPTNPDGYEHTVTVSYKLPAALGLSMMISVLGLIVFAGYMLLMRNDAFLINRIRRKLFG